MCFAIAKSSLVTLAVHFRRCYPLGHVESIYCRGVLLFVNRDLHVNLQALRVASHNKGFWVGKCIQKCGVECVGCDGILGCNKLVAFQDHGPHVTFVVATAQHGVVQIDGSGDEHVESCVGEPSSTFDHG